MRDPSTVGEAEEERSTVDSDRGSPRQSTPGPALTSRDAARAAAASVARWAPVFGWGLLALGLLAGLDRWLGLAAPDPPTPAMWPHAIVGAAFPIFAFGLAGLATALLGRLVAAVLVERIDRAGHGFDQLRKQADEGVQALERITRALESRGEPPASWTRSERDRAGLLAEIDHAARSGQWADASLLLEAFEARFPQDPSLSSVKAQLDASRRRSAQDQMAQLEAARQVNDPARVLELYQAVGPVLEIDQRTALERDLAGWFLSLVHRRLRTGKIQPEVVALATQVAETFGTTVEGASMRAALPTLRRSVGLCPRCAQPYTGVANACPQCLSGGPNRTRATNPDPGSSPPRNGGPDDPSDDSSPGGRSD